MVGSKGARSDNAPCAPAIATLSAPPPFDSRKKGDSSAMR